MAVTDDKQSVGGSFSDAASGLAVIADNWLTLPWESREKEVCIVTFTTRCGLPCLICHDRTRNVCQQENGHRVHLGHFCNPCMELDAARMV